MELVPTQAELVESPTQDIKVARIQERVSGLVEKALSLMGDAMDGEELTNMQFLAAKELMRKAPDLAHMTGSGEVHLHLNVPRPKK